MSSIERPLGGDVLVLDLGTELQRSTDPAILQRSGRSARTLLKGGAMRVTLVVLAPGGEIGEHQADGRITIQPLEGKVRFTALGATREIAPGELLSAAPGVRHSVASPDGGSFLLTVALRTGDAEDL